MDWQDIYNNWVLIPPRPVAIVHFLGGAFVGTAPHLTYRVLLESLAKGGYGIIATPFVNTFDHAAIARQALLSYERAIDYLQQKVLRQPDLPIYGLGHSMGCKLHLLINSVYEENRAGNVLISFNNYPARRSIPFLDQVFQAAPAFAVEFTPSPEETNQLVQEYYQVPHNLLIRFTDDTLDQTQSLATVITKRFPDRTQLNVLSGTHLTPMTQDVNWNAGTEFTPLDALGQFVRQGALRDLRQLDRQVRLWLDERTNH